MAELEGVEEHRARAVTLAALTPPEEVSLAGASGRVTSAAVVAGAPSPLWDNSAMDGYAVRLADVAHAAPGAPVRLLADAPDPLGGWRRTLAAGEAIAVMTGAPVPDGAEAIVPVERLVAGDGWIDVAAPAAPGAHIRRAGEDVQPGDVVVEAGQRIGPAQLGAIASTGAATVQVRARPRVAVVATGSELVAPGATLPPRGGYDSNSFLVAAAAAEAGADVVHAGTVSDDPRALGATLDAFDADLVITTGGVSMGAFDVVKAALAHAGVDFVRLAMQPGKPQGIGRLAGGAPVLALPGNPVSALASFHMFVRPHLRACLGQDPWPAPERQRVAEAWESPPEKLQVTPVRVFHDGVRLATPRGSASHLVASLARAEAWALVPVGTPRVAVGDMVEVVRWTA